MADTRTRIINLPEATVLDSTMNFVEDSADGSGTRRVTYDTLKGAINQEGAVNLAPAYSNAATYNVGDLCTYQGTLYSCSTAISTAEDWTAAHWTAVNVSAEISELKSGFTDLVTPSYATYEGYIGLNGEQIVHSGYINTDYINCSIYDLYVKTHVGNDLSRTAFYTANKQFISGYNAYADNDTEVLLDKPDSAAFVRISCNSSAQNLLSVRYAKALEKAQDELVNIDADVKVLKSDTEQIVEHSKNLLPVGSKTGNVNGVTIDYSDGVFTFNGTATAAGGRNNAATPYFTLEPGTYALSGYDNNGAIDPFFFVQINGNDYFANVGHDFTSVFTVSDETPVFIGVNVITGNSYNGEQYRLQIIKGSSSSAFQKPSYATAVDAVARTELKNLEEFWSYAMSKILCIGDSLTSGANYTGSWNGASIDQNYPRLLGRMLNADVANAGVSGITASGWYKDEISKYTLADYDSFIIWLGTNSGLTDTLDTDVNPYNDYNDYADTNTGNYCKIIEKIKADKPSSLIVLVKIFATSGSMGAKVANEVIDKIAVKYGLPVIDNSDLTSSAYPNLHGNINNPHFSKAGNIFLANRFAVKIGSIIADNPTVADFGETARTN